MTDDYFGLALKLSQQAAARLSEKDVAEIRGRQHTTFNGWNVEKNKCPCSDCKDKRSLLADRDAHLADLKEARELIVESKSFSYCSGMAPSRRCDHCKRVDALLERTK